ncbi:cyclopropane-fatty-acyl-phospholipid synthase [Candidatus Kaiserbacteria bacterium RIFCSPLOWO2_02_FULL_56_11]|nr:MAG: cyclopropane-fatty-acyl-phospholipid synthase [Candidatus Kaiserbacteria bacterium RIFCSPLOWO2_02_FULL_56_11]
MFRAEQVAKGVLAKADIHVGGSRPWDVTVHDPRTYRRVLRDGSLGLGESYGEGWWDAPAVDEFITKLLRADVRRHLRLTLADLALLLQSVVLNLQDHSRAFKIGEAHYDIGNDLYRVMLDSRMAYTCGYWSGSPPAKTLAEAQEAKLDLVCRKIGLEEGQRVLDIGCGWGSFAKFAAEKYGAQVVGITVSKEQVALGKELCKGLPVELRLQDYREVDETFDHIVSLGMFEHVGCKNYREYFKVAQRCLKEGGLFLLHTIGSNVSARSGEPWLTKYIFPGGMLPSMAQVARAAEGLFVIEEAHNFGADYDKTLMAWFANFDAAWLSLRARYDDRFYRMWKYYLLMCAGTFRARSNQLWQIILSPHGVAGGYRAIR